MSGDYLRRYTDLTALIYLLRKRKLTLLDPSSWDDSNDSHYLTLYKEKRKLKSVLALCFMQTMSDTITGAYSRPVRAACALNSNAMKSLQRWVSTRMCT
jgi:hypothetical protein